VLQKISEEGHRREASLLLSLGCDSKQAGDQRNLPCDVPFSHSLHLALPKHVYHLVALQGSPRCLERKEAHPRLDEPFNEAVILFDQVVEVLDLPQFTGLGNGSLLFQFVEGFGVGRVFVNCDDARSGGMRRSERFSEKVFGCLGIPCHTQKKSSVFPTESTAR
jgi:hypothetical protein